MIAILIGNFANAQWQKCNGPYTGSINCFTSNANIIFAGSSNGIYKSYNAGQTWVEVSNGLIQKNIYALGALGTKIFAATQDSGMFVSSNMGAQWMPVNNLPYKHISSIVTYNSKLYISADGVGVFYSQDTGSTWISINSSGLYLGISDLAVNDTAIFAATYNGLYQSYDNGITWQQSVLPMLGLQMIKIKAKGSKIAATSGNGVFISDNNGQSWNAANNDSLVYCTAFPILLSDSCLIIGTIDCGLLRSFDNGMHWEHLNSGITSYRINNLFMSDSILYVGSNGGGVYKSVNNGNNWTLANEGITNSNVYSITGSGNNLYAVNWDDGLYKSTDNGVNWSYLIHTIDNNWILKVFSKANYLYALTDNGIYRSDDYGNNWVRRNNGIDSINYATSITSSGNNLIVGREWGGGIYTSVNNGTNWLLNTNLPYGPYHKILNFTTIADTVYALTIHGILKSTDAGVNWSTIYEPDIMEFQMIDICISGNNIIVSKYPLIYISGHYYGWYGISNNNGNTWTDLNITPNMPAITSMVSNSSFIFAATSSGIFMSINNGYNWIDITYNIDNLSMNNVIINDNYLIVSTTNGGMWRRPLSDFVGITENTPNNKLSLYPNPATNSLTLNLAQLKSLQNTTVSIYDIQGKLLMQQNIYQLQTELNIAAFAKGIYFVKVTNDKETIQTKFVKE